MSCGVEIEKFSEVCSECGVRQEAASLNSDTKYCTKCGESVKIEAELCPECNGDPAPELPDLSYSASAGEALQLMLSYYLFHPLRLVFLHGTLLAVTFGLWLGWFVYFYIATFFGWKDMQKLRVIAYG